MALITYAMPTLRERISEVEQGKPGAKLPTPDYFGGTDTLVQIKSYLKEYADRLAHSMILTGWTCFEAYIQGALEELIKFHGGKDHFIELARTRVQSVIKSEEAEVTKHKRKLQEPAKATDALKYHKASRELRNRNFRFPTEALSAYGAKMLAENAGKQRFKAHMIEDILSVGLCIAT